MFGAQILCNLRNSLRKLILKFLLKIFVVGPPFCRRGRWQPRKIIPSIWMLFFLSASIVYKTSISGNSSLIWLNSRSHVTVVQRGVHKSRRPTFGRFRQQSFWTFNTTPSHAGLLNCGYFNILRQHRVHFKHFVFYAKPRSLKEPCSRLRPSPFSLSLNW